ncbi:MAG: hypothetical protein M0Q43_02240, partial [Methanothrix sp.]|nr:hypothetical protein [Methanothrix sp.]
MQGSGCFYDLKSYYTSFGPRPFSHGDLKEKIAEGIEIAVSIEPRLFSHGDGKLIKRVSISILRFQ